MFLEKKRNQMLTTQELPVSYLLTGTHRQARHLIKVIHQSKYDETVFNA